MGSISMRAMTITGNKEHGMITHNYNNNNLASTDI